MPIVLVSVQKEKKEKKEKKRERSPEAAAAAAAAAGGGGESSPEKVSAPELVCGMHAVPAPTNGVRSVHTGCV